VKANNGMTALMWAATKPDLVGVKILLDAYSDVDARDNEGETALMIAAREGDIGAVNALLKKGADVNIKTNDSAFLFWEFSQFERLPILEGLRTMPILFQPSQKGIKSSDCDVAGGSA
jgi:ankyrin repeat protein